MTDAIDTSGLDGDRLELWATFLSRVEARRIAEIGVFRGAYAAHVLSHCPAIETYYMIDPWRHLDDWNKPGNKDDGKFERIFEQAMRRTQEYERKRVVLRGRTVDVIDHIRDGSLDFAYIDGDHTLRGITIDLLRAYPKVRDGGWLGGDDFARSIWQHGAEYEPTLVFPYAVHFAEAVGARIHALPRRQFLIEKRSGGAFEFIDRTGRYGRVDLLRQLTSLPATGR
jgi:Methyltransferase domain